MLEPVVDRVFRLKFPRTQPYARMAFLTQAFMRPSRHQDALGKRLLAYSTPYDEDVRFYMVRVARGKAVVPGMRSEAERESFKYLQYFRKSTRQTVHMILRRRIAWTSFVRGVEIPLTALKR